MISSMLLGVSSALQLILRLFRLFVVPHICDSFSPRACSNASADAVVVLGSGALASFADACSLEFWSFP